MACGSDYSDQANKFNKFIVFLKFLLQKNLKRYYIHDRYMMDDELGLAFVISHDKFSIPYRAII
jgi:hypothetical protein